MTHRLNKDWIDVSISHGTLQDNDIVDAIVRALTGVVPRSHKLFQHIIEFYVSNDSTDKSMVLLEDIWGVMTELAPEGTYFGSHPGDGSDLGFWSFDDEE